MISHTSTPTSSSSSSLFSAWRSVRSYLVGALLVGSSFSACDCGTQPPLPEDAGEKCQFNSDCPAGSFCAEDKTCQEGLPPGKCLVDADCNNADLRCVILPDFDVGDCIDPNECKVDADCNDPAKICQTGSDGVRTCVFDGCETDADCIDELAGACSVNEQPKCIARGCLCRDLCGTPCAGGQQCCAEVGTIAQCIDDPGPCSRFPCEPGFHGVADVSGPWVAPACDYPEAQCRCEELPPLPDGDVGTPHILLDVSGRTVLVGYSRTYGDVVVADADTSPVRNYRYIAGVPTGAPLLGGPSGPRGGVAEVGDDIGAELAAAVDNAGILHIVARDVTHGALLHIFGAVDGPFQTEVLDSSDDAGHYPSIFIDSNNRLVIVHTAGRTSAGRSEVRLLAAPRANASVNEYRRYTLRQNNRAEAACQGGCPDGQVCPALPENAPANTVATCVAETAGCDCGSGTVCVGGSCVEEATAAPADDALSLDHLSLAGHSSNPNGMALFGHDGRRKALIGIRQTGGDLFAGTATFAETAVLSANNAASDPGHRPSAVKVVSGAFTVFTVDPQTRDLVLTDLNANFSSPNTRVIDDGLRVHPSGATDNHVIDVPALHAASDGSMTLAWQDGTDGSLWAKERRVDGSFAPSQILVGGRADATFAGNYGSAVAVLDRGEQAIVSSQHFWLDPTPALFEIVVQNNLLRCPADDAGESVEAAQGSRPLATGESVQSARGIICGGDPDRYSITNAAGCSIHVAVQFEHSDGDLDVLLIDTTETTVASSEGVQDVEEFTFIVPSNTVGDFTVEVFGFQSAENAYVIRSDVDCP